MVEGERDDNVFMYYMRRNFVLGIYSMGGKRGCGVMKRNAKKKLEWMDEVTR